MTLDAASARGRVDKEYLARMTQLLVDIPSPTGSEAEVARAYGEEMRRLGMEVELQEVEAGRPNAVGRWKGTGRGIRTLFDGHLDTSFAGTEEELSGAGYRTRTVRDGDVLVGMGTFNMKGALACYLGAIKALQEEGIDLPGEVTVAGVVGEIEKSPVDRFQGPSYRGYGRGTQYLIGHGLAADWAILGEPTGLELIRGHFGTVWVRLSVSGDIIHTAWSSGKRNAIETWADRVYPRWQAWRRRFQEGAVHEGIPGVVNLAAVEGGWPWRAARTPPSCEMFFDVRIPPPMTPAQLAHDLDAEVARWNAEDPGLEASVSYYVTEPGTELPATHPLVTTLGAAHAAVTGAPPRVGFVTWYSDAALLNRFGISAVNYGPSGRLPEGGVGFSLPRGEYILLPDMVTCTQVYVEWLIRAAQALGG